MESNGVNWEKLCPQILIYSNKLPKTSVLKDAHNASGKL